MRDPDPSAPTTVWQGRSWRLVTHPRPSADPADAAAVRGMIDHPGSVVLVPLLGDQVVLVSQYRWTLGQTILELPAGTRHPGEPPELCAQRELREETGYRAGELVPLGTIWPAPGLTNEQMHLFLARHLSADPLPMDADEQIEICLVPLAQALQMAQDGTFSDAKTIVGLLRAGREQGAGDG